MDHRVTAEITAMASSHFDLQSFPNQNILAQQEAKHIEPSALA
jgi:hypothetical protein